jgi:hypothetical protein
MVKLRTLRLVTALIVTEAAGLNFFFFFGEMRFVVEMTSVGSLGNMSP